MILTTSAYPYPVLEEERFDYVDSFYTIEQIREDEKHIYLEHRLIGADFILELLERNEARFVTTVVVKECFFRKTYDEIYEKISANRVIQKIPLISPEVNHSFFAHIVYTGKNKSFKLNYRYLDEFWKNREIKLLKGSVLAKDGWRDLDFGVGDILKIYKDENIKYSFDTEIDYENGGRIVCKMNKELFEKVSLRGSKDLHVRSIISHILSQAFFKLSKMDEIPGNFSSIVYKLKEEGMDISSEDFDAVKASLIIMPHILGERYE